LVADNYNVPESYVFNIFTNQWENQWGYTAGIWHNLKRKVLELYIYNVETGKFEKKFM